MKYTNSFYRYFGDLKFREYRKPKRLIKGLQIYLKTFIALETDPCTTYTVHVNTKMEWDGRNKP